MKDSEIHVGDVLRIREWDDMVDEYGVDCVGDIKIETAPFYFPVFLFSYQRSVCGRVFTVKAIKNTGLYKYYCSEENSEYDIKLKPYNRCTITCDMLEPFTDDEYELVTDEDISMLFG